MVSIEPSKAKPIERAVRLGDLQGLKKLLQENDMKNPIISLQPIELPALWEKYTERAAEALGKTHIYPAVKEFLTLL